MDKQVDQIVLITRGGSGIGRETIIISSSAAHHPLEGWSAIVFLRLVFIFLIDVFMRNIALLVFGYSVIALEWSILQCRRLFVTIGLIRFSQVR